MDIKAEMMKKAEAAREASRKLGVLSTGVKNEALMAMADALEKAEGKVLAYCRSGTRSTLLWALARASRGDHPAVLSEQAADAGYDLSPVTAMMDMVRGRAS